ncbi:MAG TPA: ankyrin repeat domain-containing protein, partial [Mycobacterium sp.]|nr:ankyrin repeat domain-containing protein [Mycobacterium sp.]
MARIPLMLIAAFLAGCAWTVAPMPPIIGAARDGDVARLERLLKAGADPNVHAGVNGWTPLMHAIHKNQPRSVEVLLAHGARVNERGGAGVTALIMAAGYGYTGIVETLLRAGADVSCTSDDGWDAL